MGRNSGRSSGGGRSRLAERPGETPPRNEAAERAISLGLQPVALDEFPEEIDEDDLGVVFRRRAHTPRGTGVRGRLRLRLRRRLQLDLGRLAAAEFAAALSLGVDLGP
jgi:hypothetical protein